MPWIGWLLDLSLAFGGSFFPRGRSQPGCSCGRCLSPSFQPEVADLVEGANLHFSSDLAVDSLSSGLAGDGCRRFPGCEPGVPAASVNRLAVGGARNGPRRGPAMDCGAIASRKTTASARMDWNVGFDSAPSLRVLSDRCALLWQTFGVKAMPIMSAPLRSTSLGEFWGKRWNLGFRQLSYELIFRPLHRRLGTEGAGFLVFARVWVDRTTW